MHAKGNRLAQLRVHNPTHRRPGDELLSSPRGRRAADHLLGRKGYSLQDILEMLRAFGDKNGRTGEMKWALEQAAKSL
jgi:hypothetical protein